MSIPTVSSTSRRDARFTAGPYMGKFVVAEADESGAIIAIICEGQAGSLTTIGDWWFMGMSEFELAVTEDGWDVEWLPSGSLGTPQ
ncbi:hypothetical protein APR04_004124 [Promicromonospora umidemergens]|uniref:Uncharacterized protein n=2 Tax=Promicromonospora umidemergens TaxID=629679 RepID=A0ABP8XSM3_9MICO|nr:hypothetical protein [Promicromonospora umidemergens]